MGMRKRRVFVTAGLVVIVMSSLAAANAAPPAGMTQTVVNNGPGDQTDPHISGTFVVYTDNSDGSNRIHYKSLSGEGDAVVPNNGEDDFLADVSGNAIVFTRVSTTSAIYVFYYATAALPIELAPSPIANRRNVAIGGATVAWQDFGLNASQLQPEIVVYDLTTAAATRLTNDALLDRMPAVSPDGLALVWVKCLASGAGCDIWRATKAAGTWSAIALTSAGGEETTPDTDGQIVVYGSTRTIGGVAETDIYWQPVGGGTEHRLSLPGIQANPTISGNLIAFDDQPSGSDWNVRVYDVTANALYDVASSPANETLSDISVSGGVARVAFASDDSGDSNVYAVSFPVMGGFVVDSTGDASDANTGDGVCATAGGACTLRAAIQQSNVSSGKERITFNIPSAAPHTISPTSALPPITGEVEIDATTQPGFAGKPVVELEGSKAPSPDGQTFVIGLRLAGGNSIVRGLVIDRFDGPGLWIESDGNAVEGNYVGTDVTGTVARGNRQYGILITDASSNRIGGPTAASRNLISGNEGDGISLAAAATDNLIQGNYIGIDVAGTAALGNKYDGVFIGGSFSAATGNTVGGSSAGERNVISGNGRNGVHINDAGSKNNAVLGNYIGTNDAGTAAVGNGEAGILVYSGASGVTVKGNLISGNALDGINLSAYGSGLLVQGNSIGTDAAGTADLGNGSAGVRMVGGAGGVVVGGASAAAANTIAHNGSRGAIVLGSSGNRLLHNRIHTNGSIGIDLDADGLTPNDPGDGDTGANELQNFPELTAAVGVPGGTLVQGKLNSAAATAFEIELFSNAACDSSGNGEGESYRGSATVTTNAMGEAAFTTTLPVVPVGHFITATATGASGTSEFSACKQVKDASGLLGDLIATVPGLPGLNGGQKNALLAKLQAALNSIASSNTNAACNQLGAFINQVQALLGNGLSQGEVDLLVGMAKLIKQSVGCP